MARRLESLNADRLKPFVRLALGCDRAEVVRWDQEVLKGSWEGAGNLVSRLTGTAISDGRRHPWSVIVKIPRPVRPEVDRWQREPLLYGSGLLDKLPGPMAAPRCFGIERPPGDEPWIWMEDVKGVVGSAWPKERFYLALKHLGECQGAYLGGESFPEEDWLDTSWWSRRDVAQADERARRHVYAAKQHPVAGRVFGEGRGKRLLALVDEREAILDAIAQLPQTLNHGDLHASNMIAPQGSDERTVAVDWHFGGRDVIGYDVSTSIGCATVFAGPVLGRVDEIAGPAIEAYLEGVQKSPWEGDGRLARFGCLANLAVRVTSGFADLAFRAIDDGHPLQIRDPQRLEAMMEYYSEALEYLLALAEEMRGMIPCG